MYYLYVTVGQQYPDAVQAEQKQAAFGAGKTIVNSKIYRYYLIHCVIYCFQGV